MSVTLDLMMVTLVRGPRGPLTVIALGVSNSVVHCMIGTRLDTSMIKITLNQPGEERGSLCHSLLCFNSSSNSHGWFFWILGLLGLGQNVVYQVRRESPLHVELGSSRE